MTETSANTGAGYPSANEHELLVAELQHRIKNLFAVINALARRSLSGDYSLEEARDTFIARLEALAWADLHLPNITQGGGVSLNDIAVSELRPFSDRIKIEGPDVALNSPGARHFALALHELATNASKYGALSNLGGTVSIRWEASANAGIETLRFRWQERGGPAVALPKRTGFGTSLLRASLGEGRLEYAIEGLTYEVDIPLSLIVPHKRPPSDSSLAA
jgi:two-component sensor histidine kinase